MTTEAKEHDLLAARLFQAEQARDDWCTRSTKWENRARTYLAMLQAIIALEADDDD